MQISIEMESFLREFLVIGDEVLVCRRLNLDPLILLDWTQENTTFKIKKKQAEKYFLASMERNIARESLTNLFSVIKFGERVVTNTTQNREVVDAEGNIHELVTTKVTQKINRNCAWAIRQGISLYLLKRLEDSVSRSIATLIDEGIVPENIKDQILAVLETTDTQVQEIFSGNVQNVEIDEQMLAEIQNQLLGQ